MLKIRSVRGSESTNLQSLERSLEAFRIVAQPSLSAFGYEEVYAFEIKRDLPFAELSKKVIAFYSMLGVEDLEFDCNIIRFKRGTLQGSLLRGTEADHKQTVQIVISSYEQGYSINCHFKCFTPFVNVHIRPSELENECRLLQRYLSTDAPFEPTRCALSKQTERFLNLLIPSTLISVLLVLLSLWNPELLMLTSAAVALTIYFWIRFFKFRRTHL